MMCHIMFVVCRHMYGADLHPMTAVLSKNKAPCQNIPSSGHDVGSRGSCLKALSMSFFHAKISCIPCERSCIAL